MKRCLLLLLLSCMQFNMFAKSFKFGLGLGANLSAAQLSIAGSKDFGKQIKPKIGFTIGIPASYILDKKLAKMQLESGFYFQVASCGNEFVTSTLKINMVNTFYSFRIPLLFRYRVYKSFWAEAGVVANYNFRGTQSVVVADSLGSSNPTKNSTNELLRPLQIGFRAAAAYHLNSHIELMLSYSFYPQGNFKNPNYNNQYFKHLNVFGVGARYWW